MARIGRELDTQSGFVAVQGERLVGFLLWSRLDGEVADLRTRAFRTPEVSTVADDVAHEPYDRTRRFYRARGFRGHRVDPRYWGSGDDRHDRLVLRRDLSFL